MTEALAKMRGEDYLQREDGAATSAMERGGTMTKAVPPEAEENEHGDEVPVVHTPLPDDEFKTQLAQVIPHLRAFGRSLSGNRDLADDLVFP